MFCSGHDPGALVFFLDPEDDKIEQPLPDAILVLASLAVALTALGLLALSTIVA